MWLPEVLVGFDLETTSSDPSSARIVSFALTWEGAEDTSPRRVAGLVDPGVPISPDAVAVHGITDSMAQSDGVPHADALVLIGREIKQIWSSGGALVVFNAAYDLTILDRCTPGGFPILGPVIDPLVLSRMFVREGSHRLGAVARTFGVALDRAHEADADAVAAQAVAGPLLAQLGQLVGALRVDVDGPEELMAVQHRAALGQQQMRAEVGEQIGWPRAGDLRSSEWHDSLTAT